MMTHTVEKSYICKECYKTFSDKNNMVTHISTNLWTHTQHEKPYKCSTCYERFIQPNQLRGNMIIHTGEFRFSRLWLNALAQMSHE